MSRAVCCGAVLALLSLGCGARTGLSVPEVDAEVASDAGRDGGAIAMDAGVDAGSPSRDAGVDAGIVEGPPGCWEPLLPGEVRGAVADIDGRPAYDAAGNLYAPRRVGLTDRWQLVSYDACLRPRWELDLPAGFMGREGEIRTSVDALGRVWVKRLFSLARATREGVLVREPIPVRYEGSLWGWIATPAAGPVFEAITDRVHRLYRVEGSRADALETMVPSTYFFPNECLLAGRAVHCWDVGFDDALRLAYQRTPTRSASVEFAAGASQVAFDGERLWSLGLGARRAALFSMNVGTAEVERWPTGVSPMFDPDTGWIAAPVVASDGTLLFVEGYEEGGRPQATLFALARDGSARWSFVSSPMVAPAAGVVDSMIAVGDAEVVYLALDRAITAIDLRSAEVRWNTPPLVGRDAPDLQMSSLGDLALRALDGTLVVVASESRSLAASPWPIAGADPGATFATP